MKKISLPSTSSSAAKQTSSDDESESSLHVSSLREKSSDQNNFLQATRHGFYNYWLTLVDVIDIARVEYNNFKYFKGVEGLLNADFQPLNSLSHLIDKITNFQIAAKQLGSARMTLIINTGYSSWKIMALSYHENHEKIFRIMYVSSLNRRLGEKIQNYFITQKVLFYDLSQYLYERMDTHDVGLWALEIANDLNKMLNENYDLEHMIIEFAYLSHLRNTNYFKQKRKTLANKLSSDIRFITHLTQPSTSDQDKVVTLSPLISPEAIEEPKCKKIKVESKKESVQFRLEAFVEAFIKDTGKLLSLYHVAAKRNRLTTENLINELETGATGALLGMAIADGIVGSIPSLVATARAISSHYYFSNDKACKITKAFENIPAGQLTPLLGIVALDIFYSYESQFMSVTDKAGCKISMEKLAGDAAARSLNYIAKNQLPDSDQLITRELLSQGVLFGKSEKYFSPNIKPLHIVVMGSEILNEHGQKISTADLYNRAGIRIFNTETHELCFYQLKKFSDSSSYGYRRLLDWEEQENGELKEIYSEAYQVLLSPNPEDQSHPTLQNYEYYLDSHSLEEQANTILEKIQKIRSIQPMIHVKPKTPIYFNLRKSVNNFTGRKEVLSNLHNLLTTDGHIAVITQDLARLNLDLDQASSSVTPTAQISLTGLGGVGKTQVALRYAEIYASYYDDNIIWIDAETKDDIINSFKELSRLINISNKNVFGNDKTINELLPEIYNYFSGKKSLFIFDNVENYREFEQFLPIKQINNTPTFLITSRFSHWNNILPVLTLNVFTYPEAIEFVKKKLNILTDELDQKIIELINLLHRLPLALQQAITYVEMQKYIDSQFSIEDYIKIFKEKSEEVLQFESSDYSNDPYLKSVFIIWNVTLEKIKNNKDYGEKALEILNIMAYLYPDHITNSIFSSFENPEKLIPAIHLLQSYSIINMGNRPDISVIHRLVQKVIRINLEKNFEELEKNTAAILRITQNFHENFELSVHHIYFLLHISQNKKLYQLKLGVTKNRIMDTLIISGDKIILARLYDTARLILLRDQYFNFMGDALFFYIKQGLLFSLSETISYIEKNLEDGMLLKSDVKIILDYCYKAEDEDLTNWLVYDSDGKERQIHGVRLVSDFENKIFFKKASSCRFKKRKRRDTSCLSKTFNRPANQTLLVQSHLKFVAHCAQLISSEQTSNQVISPNFLREEWNHTALHFRTLIKNDLLNEVSDIEWLSEELSLLAKKELIKSPLNRTAFDIFQNKLSVLNKKKTLFKEVTKIAQPFTRLSRFSIDHSTHFEKELKDYHRLKTLKALKKEAAHSSLSVLSSVSKPEIDPSFTSIAKNTAEAFHIFSEVTEPEEYLMEHAIRMGLWLTNHTYHAIRQVDQIKQYVHLDKQETLIEDLRAFMNIRPSSYLTAKAANNLLIKKALVFLKKHTSIQKYIFPAILSPSAFPKNIQISLQKQQSIKLSAEMPDKPDEGTLFCLSGRLGSDSYVKSSAWVYILPYPPFMRPKNLLTTYLCEAAIGIEFSQNRTNNITLIDLNEGNTSAIGMPNLPNIFLVKKGNKHYKGGDVENLFLIQGRNITGVLEGGKGLNIIKLKNLVSTDPYYTLVDNQMLFCIKNRYPLDYQCDKKGLQLQSIQHIYGRENKSDIIFINKDIQYVDGLAGESHCEDHIYLTVNSKENFWIMLRPHTVIHAFVPNQRVNATLIDYKLIPESGSSLVQVDCNESIHHRFNIEFSLTDLFVLSIIRNEIVLKFFYTNSFFELNILALESHAPCLSSKVSKVQFLLKNKEIRLINEDYLFIRDLSSSSINELVAYYLPLTLRLHLVIQIYSVEKNLLLQMGHDHYAILYNEPSVKNYLIAQSDKTTYLIKPPLKTTDSSLSEIVIYSVGKKSFSNLLDLREVWKKIKKNCANHTLLIDIVEENKDLILSLSVNSDQLNSDQLHTSCVIRNLQPIISIKLHRALVDNSYQNLEILLYSIPYGIARNEKSWYLEAYPLVFNRERNLILLTKDDLLPDTNIVLLKRISNGKFNFFCHKETDLMLSNAFDPRTQPNELCTVVYSQFYRDPKMRTLSLSSKITLIDQKISLQEQTKNIDTLPCSDISSVNLTLSFNHFFTQPSDILNKNKRSKRDTKIRNNNANKNFNNQSYLNLSMGDSVKAKRNSFENLTKAKVPLLTRGVNTLMISSDAPFSDSSTQFSASAANNLEINSQSLFFRWIYHMLWGRKPKTLIFKKNIELEHENQVYRALEKFEKLQNKSNYSRK